MTRKSEQLARIEDTLTRLEENLASLGRVLVEDGAAIRAEVRGARSAAEAAAGAVQGLAAVVSSPGREAARAAPDTGTDNPAPRSRRATRTPQEQSGPDMNPEPDAA